VLISEGGVAAVLSGVEAACVRAGAEWSEVFARGAEPDRGYVLAMTPRSGSTWLARMLTATGVLGRPDEYLLPGHPLVVATKPRSLRWYLSAVARASATQNGVWAIKGDLPQLSASLPLLAARCVLLTREDRLAQAVSLYRAVASGVWDDEVPDDSIPFDPAAIGDAERYLAAMEQGWDAALAGRDVLRVTYEQLVREPLAVVASVASMMGIEALPDIDPDDHGHIVSGAEGRSWRLALEGVV
jgi:LPS sulfotransferase NodH